MITVTENSTTLEGSIADLIDDLDRLFDAFDEMISEDVNNIFKDIGIKDHTDVLMHLAKYRLWKKGEMKKLGELIEEEKFNKALKDGDIRNLILSILKD